MASQPIEHLYLAAAALRETDAALEQVPEEVRNEVIELLEYREMLQAEIAAFVLQHLDRVGA
jgi:hypothetical protein